MADAWGKLAFVEDAGREAVPLVKRTFIIGRARDCDLVVSRKMVSAHHCFLEYDEAGTVTLHDTSSNGTLVNGSQRLLQGKVVLASGDKFCIAFDKGKANTGMSFVLELSNNCSGAETDETEEYNFDESTDKFDSSLETEAIQPAVVDAKAESLDQSLPEDAKASVAKESGQDEIAQNLTCSICQEILYNCVSLLPCMHCFCAGCYSDWMALSRECPQCRANVGRIVPNHIVNGVVESLLRQHPKLRRDENDLKELDKKNKITREMLYPTNRKRKCPWDGRAVAACFDDDDSDDEDYEDDDDVSDEYDLPEPCVINAPTHSVQCRQCPGQRGGIGGSSAAASPSHLDYVCTPDQVHFMCRCCKRFMPSRATMSAQANVTIPPQSCANCFNIYCHVYWGCNGLNCRGCLAPFKDLVFSDSCLAYIINRNPYESLLLTNYLQGRGMTAKDLVQQCLSKYRDGTYTVLGARVGDASQYENFTKKIVCMECGVRILAELAYQYRRDIPVAELPAEVARENCYWGNKCRTQSKFHHAKRFNHICEQTRF